MKFYLIKSYFMMYSFLMKSSLKKKKKLFLYIYITFTRYSNIKLISYRLNLKKKKNRGKHQVI